MSWGEREHPILNTPYVEPSQHWALDSDGVPNGQIKPSRRPHKYVVPVAKTKRRNQQAELDYAGDDEGEENTLVNLVRPKVDAWRRLPASEWNVTPETERLLKWWRDAEVREYPFFFCQLEAIETLIWLTEVAPKSFREEIITANEEPNAGLYRIAAKMATGSGKTTVMAMAIIWQTVNAARRPTSTRFTSGFLIIAPGITIRDRLKVLMPNATDNYYEDSKRRFVPPEMLHEMSKARVVVTNYHSFQLREKIEVKPQARKLLGDRGEEKRFPESPDDMIRRVAKDLLGLKRIMILNDEAHHCYEERKNKDEERKIESDEKDEAKENNAAARVWINGVRAFAKKFSVLAIFDLSATPFFLRGSGYNEGFLFPWVVSDFSLMDAIECGIVKTPRVPVLDDTVRGDMPKWRELYRHMDPKLKIKAGRKKDPEFRDPEKMDELLRGAMEALYAHYEKVADKWSDAEIERPPVFIVVASNTAMSKLIYDFISGYAHPDDSTRLIAGKLDAFSNVDENGRWRKKPLTLIVDSAALEASDSLPDDFQKTFGREISEFKAELARTNGAAEAEKVSDAQLMREVMNTVGQPGKLGADIRCVVSVSMLTEGWDANTVTHVLGVRAFGTQLLCEQVVGRALRRVNYQPDEHGYLRPEYADVLGIPFDFTPDATVANPVAPPKTIRIRAQKDRADCEIRFPNVAGYRISFPPEPLRANFTEDSRLQVTNDDIPTSADVEPIVGEGIKLTLKNYESQRMKSVYYAVAGHTLREYFREDETGNVELHRFGELLRITERWFDQCLTCQGHNEETLKRTFLWRPMAQKAAERIFRACQSGPPGQEQVRAILNPYNETGSSKYVDFVTSKTSLFRTDPALCHVDQVVADQDWEMAFVEAIERDLRDIVSAYIKNHNLGFEVPYEFEGATSHYRPDFILKIDDGRGADDLLHMVCEVKGRRSDKDAAKADTMHTRWIPAVNNLRRYGNRDYGRWAFHEFTDPYNFARDLRALLSKRKEAA